MTGQNDHFRLLGAIAQLQQDPALCFYCSVPWAHRVNDLQQQQQATIWHHVRVVLECNG